MPVEAHVPVVTSEAAKAVLVMVTFDPIDPSYSMSHADDTQPPPTLVDDATHDTVLCPDRSDDEDDALPSEMVSVALLRPVGARDTIRSPVYARLDVQEAPLQLLMGSTGCMVVRAVM